MSVFGKEKCHQLRVDGLVAAEITSKETADELSIDRSVIPWEVYVFDLSEKAFKIGSEFLYLGGFSGSVQAFKDY